MTEFLTVKRVQPLAYRVKLSVLFVVLLGIIGQREAIAQQAILRESQSEFQLIEQQQTSAAYAEENVGNLEPTSNYTLSSGDRVYMDFVNVPDYSREYQVLDGQLSLPLIGSVLVQGMTLDEATAEITNRFSQYVRRPNVVLDLRSSRPMQIAVVGEVHRPGSYNVSLETEDDISGDGDQLVQPTVTQAIQLAGGITQSADIRNITIRRPHPQQPGEYWFLEVSLWDLLQSGDLQQDLPLKDGDTVLVPTATNLDYAETATLAAASFSPESITVNVVGEVDAPGAIEVPPNTPLNQALLAAGGFNDRATRRSVELIRLNPNGTVLQQDIEIDFTQDVNDVSNPALRNNDTLVVRQSRGSRTLEALTDVLPPISGIINLLRIFTPL